MDVVDVRIPDIGDFRRVPLIEVLARFVGHLADMRRLIL